MSQSLILSLLTCIFAHLVAFSSPAQGQSVTYYVDAEKGRDSNQGTSAEPFQTIQHAIDALAAGDDIVIRSGRYREAPKLTKKSGTRADPIEIRGEGTEKPIIDSLEFTELKYNSSGFYIADSEYIVLSGIHINGSYRHGIGVFDSRYIILRDNVTYNTGQSGIHVRVAEHVLAEGNDVSRAVQQIWQECVSFREVHHFVIRDNHVHDRPKTDVMSLQGDFPIRSGGEGIDVKDGSTHGAVHGNLVEGIEGKFGIYVDASSRDSHHIEVYNNVVRDCGCGLVASSENGTSERGLLRYVRFYNNVSYNNSCGMFFGSFGGDPEREDKTRRVWDVDVFNNTIVNNGPGGGIDIGNPDAKRIIIKNNILVQNTAGPIRLTAGLKMLPGGSVAENNIIFGRNVARSPGENITADPLFVNQSDGDFRLRSRSPAIDAGVREGAPEVDHLNRPRPQGRGIDIGAYEYMAEPADAEAAQKQ